uniref:K Homology domain-containing protein n=1 Tax=Globodera rostochiensis TaxID=31243 RepID=A0A914I8G2_GLORO
MAMKDLFCLVNAFINRNKVTEDNQKLAVPIEAAEDTRVLPGSSSSTSKQLLPDLCGMDMNQQKKLHKALYSAGVNAALSLEKFVCEVPKKRVDNTGSDETFPEDFDVNEVLEHLNKSAFDDASKTFRMMSNNMEEIMQKMNAAALAAFASATLRKPPTKHVENLMQTSQENGHPLLVDEDTSDTDPILSREMKRSIVTVAELDDDDECACNSVVDEEIEGDDSLFRYVCAAGYDDLAKLLISMRNSAEFVQQSDSTPLMESCCGGHSDVVRILVQAGADVNALSSTQNTALIYACASGHIECVRELLATGRCDLTIRNEAGHCALMEAANIGNVEIMKALIQHGAKVTCVVESVEYKESPLTLAAFKGHYDAAKYLLSLMSETKNEQEEEELYTALIEASMDGHVENPLTLAAGGGHNEMVKLLLDSGADLEEPNDEGYTPLMEASREGHLDVVELLLNRGANVNAKIEDGLETPLTLAASGGFKNVVELLVLLGGDLTIGERTPLYEACQEGHEEVAQFIVQHLRKSYSLQVVQKDLNEALLCTAGIDSDSICDLLIENGAQIDCFSKENRTPLMEAARQNCTKVVELLIKKGADVNKIASPCVGKDVDVGLPKSKSSKKLSQKDCCPTLKCPCCVPPSLKKNAKEVCTAAGIPPAPFTTGHPNAAKKPAPSRSSTPSQNKTTTTSAKSKFATPLANNATVINKTQRSLSTSSSSATLSDPSAWLDNSTTSDLQNNDTALTLACVGGHAGLVDLLIKRGAHIEHLCKLLIDAGAQLDAQADRTKDTALSLACSGGRKNVAELLLKNGANKEHRNLSDYTPLSLAASGGYVDIIQLLLSNGAEINSRTNSKLGISPLMLAAMNGHEEATRLLLENGSDINAQIETNKNTALTLACFQGRTEVTRLLIQYGANVEHRAKTGLTPLMEAANGGYVDVGTILIQSHADVNTSPVPTSRDTALTIAADKGHAAFVGLLLRHEAQINARNKKGCTAIWLACNNGHLDTVHVLVDYKADNEAQDNRKLTPLMVAFRKGHSKLVHFLLQHVTQFPSDSDCQRFISTLTDQELIEKCRQSVLYISEAKEKQAEQANKAAQSLLALLAHEEALEESKKRSKQRQKEKKKMDAEVVLEGQIVKSAEKKAETAEIIPKQLELPTKTGRISPKSSPKPNSTQNSKQPKCSSSSTKEKTSQNTIAQQVKKTQNSPVEPSAKNNTKKALAAATLGQQNSCIFTNVEEEEWLRMNKKLASIKMTESNKVTASAISVSSNSSSAKSSSSASSTQQNSVSQPSSEEQLFSELAVLAGRRSSLQVLNIAANAIARVIGRGGSNVNAIREATGAHVEVEKQSTRKEQTTRKITLRGPADSVRNAMRMIDLLMRDHNVLINEIVDRVMASQRKSPSLSSSSETSSCQPLQLQPAGTLPSSVPSSPMVINGGKAPEEALKKLPSHSIGSRVVGAAGMAPISPLIALQTQSVPQSDSQIFNSPTTNVWQKRAEAIREKKAVLNEHPTHRLVSPISPSNSSNCQSVDLRKSGYAPALPITVEGEVKFSLNAEELAILSKEEHQRKAPGYARPLSSASSTNQQLALANMKAESSNASTLFDVLTSRWSTNPLESAVGNDSSNNGDSNLQNSWSYLLEYWKNYRQQRFTNQVSKNDPYYSTDL